MTVLNFPPTAGEATDGSFTYEENGVVYSWDGTKWTASATTFLSGHRNWIINGNFNINQRNGTRTPGVGVYGFDRWKGNAGGLEQVVEALPAGTYTLSWTGGGNGTFGGTTAASPITATVTAGNTSVVVPSDATLVQLERGTSVTPFEHRPIGTELALCQRYYQTIRGQYYATTYARSGGSGDYRVVNLNFNTQMRQTPTVSNVTITGGGSDLQLHANPSGFSAIMAPKTVTNATALTSCDFDAEL
jgi:hypothetical protein